MVNILYVMPEFKLAGAETMCTTLASELSSKYHIIVASLYDINSSLIERMSERGIKVVFLHKKRGLDLSIIVKLAKLMKSEHIHVVHTHRYVCSMQYRLHAILELKFGFILFTVLQKKRWDYSSVNFQISFINIVK